MQKFSLKDDFNKDKGFARSLNHINDVLVAYIANAAYELSLSPEKQLSVNLEIGTIVINFSGDSPRYRFEPSQALDVAVVDAFYKHIDKAEAEVNAALINKFDLTLEDFF